MKVALILIVILFIALSPVIGLRPSLRQKRLVALREMARRHETRVTVEKTTLFSGASPATVGYRLRYPRELQGPRFALIREKEERADERVPTARWQKTYTTPLDADTTHALDAFLEQLPTDAHALESDAAALTLWWDESLSSESFEPLLKQFKHIHVLLMKRYNGQRRLTE